MFPTSVFLLTSHSHPFPITDRLVLIWLVPTGQVRLTEVAGTRAKEEKETKNIPHLPRSDRQTLGEVFTTYRSPSEEMWLCQWGCVLHSCVCPSSAFHLKKKKFFLNYYLLLLLFFFCLLAKKKKHLTLIGQILLDKWGIIVSCAREYLTQCMYIIGRGSPPNRLTGHQLRCNDTEWTIREWWVFVNQPNTDNCCLSILIVLKVTLYSGHGSGYHWSNNTELILL